MAQRQFRSDDTSTWSESFGRGTDGALSVAADTTDATANTTISVTSGSTAATFGSFTGFADGNLLLIHQSRNGGAGAGAWELNKVNTHSGTAVTLGYPTVQAYDTTAQVYLLKQYSSVSISTAKTLTSSAWGGSTGGIIALLCNGTVTVTGNISLDSKGFIGGAALNSVNGQANCGEGTGGASTTQSTANGNGAGGGNQGNGGGGGNGASGGNGSGGTTTDGTGGSSVGNVGLTVADFGGAGGGGNSAGTGNGAGGNGGGFLLIIAPTITVTGGVSTNGANGGAAAQRSGGGGAGGSVLLKCQTGTLGTTLVNALAGSGGVVSSNRGGNGGAGRIHIDYVSSFTGTTSPTIDSRQDTSLIMPAGATFLLNFI